ncbi:uncharacterized protein LOC142777270 [Rhipicephalus microplus]|uniref:uncharacterized protein LOC142777270 n=1 Tax=Rhipicephalus microplus TaxID=6941 RepID=UPI003F6BFE41
MRTLALCYNHPSICESVRNDTYYETACAVRLGDYTGASFDYPLSGTALFADVPAPWSTRAVQDMDLSNPLNTVTFSEHGSNARSRMAHNLFFSPQVKFLTTGELGRWFLFINQMENGFSAEIPETNVFSL